MPRQIAAATVVVSMLLLAFGVLRLGLAELRQNDIATALERGQDDVTSIDDILGASGGTGQGAAPADPTVTQTTQPAPDISAATAGPTTSTTTTTTTTTTLPSEPVDYLAIGDSVMLGAAGVLSDRGYIVNAEESRQMIDMVPVMEQLGAADLFGDPVIVHLGTNGPFTEETLNAFLAPLSQRPERAAHQRAGQPAVDRCEQRLARGPRQEGRQPHPARLGRRCRTTAPATASPTTASTSPRTGRVLRRHDR